MSEKELSEQWLDPELVDLFRQAINSSSIFVDSEEHAHRYNLVCTVMDRLDSAVKVLNRYDSSPNSEEGFILFMVYACIVRDGIYKLYENVFQHKPSFYDSTEFFSEIENISGRIVFEENIKDDVFFEYLRTMVFAHPFETGYRKGRLFMEKEETQLSPFIVIEPKTAVVMGRATDLVGVRVYSNEESNDFNCMLVSFQRLKAYVASRYLCIEELTEWAKNSLEDYQVKWRANTVERSSDLTKTLDNAISILKERFQNTFSLEVIREYYSCVTSEDENRQIVDSFRNEIAKRIPLICDAIDALDYEEMETIIAEVCDWPDGLSSYSYYQLEKLFEYLDIRSSTIVDGSNEAWGLLQARCFYDEVAKPFVRIDFDTMDYDEIKMLIAASLFYLRKNKNDGIN